MMKRMTCIVRTWLRLFFSGASAGILSAGGTVSRSRSNLFINVRGLDQEAMTADEGSAEMDICGSAPWGYLMVSRRIYISRGPHGAAVQGSPGSVASLSVDRISAHNTENVKYRASLPETTNPINTWEINIEREVAEFNLINCLMHAAV